MESTTVQNMVQLPRQTVPELEQITNRKPLLAIFMCGIPVV
jgi:hypothetical protein